MRLPAPPSPLDLQGVQLIATDVDGTLTQAGQMNPQLLHDLTQLQQADIDVILVTGRSAGWVSAFAHYFPVAGAIAENGGVFCPKSGDYHLFEGSIAADLAAHRQALGKMFTALKAEVPRLQESRDNAFRLTDWTFDVADLTVAELRALGDRCRDAGWGFTYSTVQCHIAALGQTKAIAGSSMLRDRYPQLSRSAVLTIGDSPNDESLFDSAQFPCSIGVANIAHYWARLGHHPKFVTDAAEGEGFHEVVSAILS